MKIDVVTTFPDYFAPLHLSLVGKAISSGLIELGVHDLRQWTYDRHHTTDDTPYGGGAGMVMKPEPWGEALDHVEASSPAEPTVVIPTPAGSRFAQSDAYELASKPHLVFACGRYEGIDQRVIDYCHAHYDTRELSLGDYVLNGGEVAVLAMTEAIVRLIPGVIGNPDSLREESHSDDNDRLLEYPNYTKPPSWRGRAVPDVLLSGNHGLIAKWRREQSEARTRQRRPDLMGNEG